MDWFTGKGYGVSDITDISGRPFLTYQGPEDKKPYILSDRVAQTFDFTVAQSLPHNAAANGRMDSALATTIKNIFGGTATEELDHKIPLELGGANSYANLRLEEFSLGSKNTPTDQLENALAEDVESGRKSLLEAWRTLAKRKGYVLGEDLTLGVTFSFSEALRDIIAALKNTLSGGTGPELNKLADAMKVQLADDFEKVKANPLDKHAMAALFAHQLTAIQAQIGGDSQMASDTMRTYAGLAADAAGINAKELETAMGLDIQQMIQGIKNPPNVYGISSAVIEKIIGTIVATGGALIGIGAIISIIAALFGGPEILAGLSGLPIVGPILATFGLSIPAGIAGIALSIAEITTAVAFGLNMTVKGVYDNGYLYATQVATSIGQAVKLYEAAGGKIEGAAAPKYAGAPAGGVSAAPQRTGPPPKLFIGHINAGTLAPVAEHAAQELSNISTNEELTSAAHNHVAAYLSKLSTLLSYEVKLKPKVVLSDGTEVIGSVVKVPTHVTKKGVQKYKDVGNKFAVVEIYATKTSGGKVHVGELVLGPVDETQIKPAAQDLVQIGNALAGETISTSMEALSGISFAPKVAAQPPIPGEQTPEQRAAAYKAAGVEMPPAPVAPAPVVTPPAATPNPPQTTPIQAPKDVVTTYQRNGQTIYVTTHPNGSFDESTTPPTPAAPQAPPAPAVLQTNVKVATVNVAVLNVRAAPNSAAALAGSKKLARGDQFNVTGYVHGENVAGEDRWWLSMRGDYVWVGGTHEKP